MAKSLSKLFENIGDELHSGPNKLSKKRINLFDQMEYELSQNQLDELDVGAAVKKGVGAVGGTLKRVFDFLKTKIKKISRLGFRLGYAIGQTVKNKFVLFSRKGKILTPELDKIGYEQYDGRPTLTFWMKKQKGKEHKMRISENLDFGFGSFQLKPQIGVMSVIDTKGKAPLKEGIDYPKGQKMLTEITEKEAMAQLDIATAAAMDSFADEGFKALQKPAPKAKSVIVDYEAFAEEINDLMDSVQYGSALKEAKIGVLGIYAPTGWGKSDIIHDMAESRDFHYFPLELQKVAPEVVAGFPYLEDIEKADEDTKEKRAQVASKIVKMAPSSILPESDAPGNWILFFDEFNRADTEKMSAVMNLLLTGELGGASSMVKDPKTGKMELKRYSLPKKTAVILAMNTGEQKGIMDAVNAVNDMDIATLERVHRIVFGRYHAGSWFQSWALKTFKGETKAGDKFILPHRIPPIITQYIAAVAKGLEQKDIGAEEKTPPTPWEKPFLIPIRVARGEEGKGGGGERTTSPRAWTHIADSMIKNGMVLWKKLKPKEKEKYTKSAEKIMAEIKKKDPTAPDDVSLYRFAAWMKDARNQMLLLAKESPELGEEGEELINKMLRHFWKTGKEGVGPEQILFNYKSLQKQVKENYKNLGFGSHSQLMGKLYTVLGNFETEKSINEYMKEHSFEVISKLGALEQISLTIEQLFEDLDMSMGDFKTFAVKIKKSRSKSEVFDKLHLKLANWDIYREASRGKTKAELEKEGEEGEE